MKVYAVLDTNVLVSALMNDKSIPGQVVSHSLDGEIIPLLNDEIIAEYVDVLHRPKFHFLSKTVTELIAELIKRGIFIDAGPIDGFFKDPKDVVFYAVTMEAKKDRDAYLVTGNLKHFPNRSFVVTPREMMEILKNQF